MKNGEIERLRVRLNLDRHQFGRLLGISYRGLMNIENGVRNPSPLAIKLLRYIDSLPKAKALAFMEELNRHDP